MSLAPVSGSLHDIIGSRMGNKEAVIEFYLVSPQLVATTSLAGGIRPTEPVEVVPSSDDGTFTISLTPTDVMLGDAFYRLRIRWLGEGHGLIDFPTWEIRVPSSGGNLADMIDFGGGSGGGGGGVNPNIWWVSADVAPPSNRFTWLITDPDNPDRENSGISGTTIGDVRVWR